MEESTLRWPTDKEREPMASGVAKALETAMLLFEKQNVDSVKLMQLRNLCHLPKVLKLIGVRNGAKYLTVVHQ